MKQLMKTVTTKIFLFVVALFACTLAVLAQDKGSVTTSKHTEAQFVSVQPWVWIAGGAVFILLLIAILRGGKKRDSVTVTKTTTTENSDI